MVTGCGYIYIWLYILVRIYGFDERMNDEVSRQR